MYTYFNSSKARVKREREKGVGSKLENDVTALAALFHLQSVGAYYSPTSKGPTLVNQNF
jgi:hypothetical protein